MRERERGREIDRVQDALLVCKKTMESIMNIKTIRRSDVACQKIEIDTRTSAALIVRLVTPEKRSRGEGWR